MQTSQEPAPPLLPPRPAVRTPSGYLAKPQLLSRATTALSSVDIQAQPHQRISEPRSPYLDPSRGVASRQVSLSNFGRYVGHSGSEAEDSASVRSYAPALEVAGDAESLLGEVLNSQEGTTFKGESSQAHEAVDGLEPLLPDDIALADDFSHAFDELEKQDPDEATEERLVTQWRTRLKHFLIFSSAGKPIYTRHGDDELISHYVGVMQTIISFFQGAEDELKGFVAGDARFTILSKGHLYLVAISRIGESDTQLRVQLEALYMQVLSTLTLPVMQRMFAKRASTDLRRPLEGTEILLSALADGFTRGSPSTLLSALECLRMRKSHRQVINSAWLKVKSPSLLYGLIVAGGRLVSVVRPRKHSLHPGDLHLIFNMLFEAGGVKAAGGENWIPLCLPGFNNTGYLYMYVSFLSAADRPSDAARERPIRTRSTEDEVAIIIVSANKEGFDELRKMRDDLVQTLDKNGSMEIIRSAITKGRPSMTDVVPGVPLRHFIYKSRGNVQFIMPSFEPLFDTAIARRRLMLVYQRLHTAIHTKHSQTKVHHCVTRHGISLAWVTPLFELYCVGGPHISRAALAQGANKVIQWVRREEEKVFIIGGAVF